MDNSEEIAEIQRRFQSAARAGEGLTLSPREVYLLASLEPELPAPVGTTPLLTPYVPLPEFERALRLIHPHNPFTHYINGGLCDSTWSMFKDDLEKWMRNGITSFHDDKIEIQHPRMGTIKVPLNGKNSPQPVR